MSKKRNAKEKKVSSSSGNEHMNKIVLALGIILVLAGIIGIDFNPGETDEWTVSEEGILSYNQRGDPDYSLQNMTGTGDTDILKLVKFKSRDAEIEGMLRIPESDAKVPGVVVLPGAGVSKEAQTRVPEMLARNGYASITIDQRNLGGINPELDLELFKEGSEPVEYLMVYDALIAADVLRDQPELDGDIAMLGLSNGGRFAIIATAIEPDIKGIVAISTSGYDTGSIDQNLVTDENTYTFYRSIDPDNYLDMISPRRFVMFHSINDTIIPFELAQRTFSQAQEPKKLYKIEGSSHGYSQEIENYIDDELDKIFDYG